jgi:hypothetical protein
VARLVLAAAVATFVSAPATALAQSRFQAPESLTDAEFWKFFTSMSEPDGYFLSENFVSNEVSFQEVIPSLQRSLTKSGVYLGVGPEQNFTYIANLNPRMAVIFDIRRQNAMQHLMYKALFELSPTRAEFVARLFSRPSLATLASGIAVKELFDSAAVAAPTDSAYKANLAAIVELLTVRHGFALPKEDLASIEHVYDVFFAAGPDVNYGYRSGSPAYVRSTYPTFGMLQSATNADSVEMAFLATEDNYQAVRAMHLRNLIVPVVGDFGGPSAIRSVGKWLHERAMTVTAFYVSNVEQYLFRENGASERFYGNVSSLPIDSTSRFIRSVPRTSGAGPMMSLASVGITRGGIVTFTMPRDSVRAVMQTLRDSAGVPVVRMLTFRDSAGVMVVDSTRRDSAGARAPGARDSTGITRPLFEITSRVPRDSVARDSVPRDTGWVKMLRERRDSVRAASWRVVPGPAMSVMMGGMLTSGLASMKGTLDAFFLGELKTYNAVVDMTKVGPGR